VRFRDPNSDWLGLTDGETIDREQLSEQERMVCATSGSAHRSTRLFWPLRPMRPGLACFEALGRVDRSRDSLGDACRARLSTELGLKVCFN
jgi:hypothetical protein